MGICPRCGEEINHLKHWDMAIVYYNYTSGGNYDEEQVGDCDGEGAWECPQCYCEVACNEADADDILNAESEDEEVKEVLN